MSNLDFSEYLDILDDSELEEIPVDIDTFINGEEYLGRKEVTLSDYQRQAIKASTQIYKKETLQKFLSPQEAEDRWKQTCSEVTLMLGKSCHAPYTPVYNANTGAWQRLDSFTNPDNTVVGYTDGELAHEYATESFYEGYGRMLRVKTRLGLEEDVYEGHKYYAWHNKHFYKRNRTDGRSPQGPSWIEAKDLTLDHKIAVGAGFDVADPKDIPVSHLRMIAYLLGDGMCPADYNRSLNVDFGEHEVESMQNYRDAMLEIGDEINFIKHPNKKMFYSRLSGRSNAFALIKKYELWGKRAHDKEIPQQVWSCSNELLREFVGALWSTDGCVYMKKAKGITPVAEYCSISKQLVIDLQKILLRLGVPATISDRVPTYTYKGERLKGQRAYYLTVVGEQNFVRFAGTVKLFDTKKLQVERGLKLIEKYQHHQNLHQDNLYWNQITSIKDIGDGEYWTMTQPSSSNYLGNGMISHQSGKDFMSALSCCYIVYQLLCLKDPSAYYGKPSGDSIDLVNIAINAAQANNVFFKNVVRLIKKAPWFRGKYDAKPLGDPAQAGQFNFIKEVTLYSGHSERESFEGLNCFLAVLDEISGFALESSTANGKTAEAVYEMYRASVSSRFSEFGKVLLLSFPRYKGDFISKHYDSCIANKETRMRQHTFKIDPDLPDGVEGNHFSIEWEEDFNLAYKLPKIYCLKRPTWEVNPTKTIDEFMPDFYRNRPESLGRFAAMPPDAVDAFFKDKQKIEDAFIVENGVDEGGRFKGFFQAEPDKEYFIHVDLALKHDNCAVALAHVDRWQLNRFNGMLSEEVPVVYVDAVRWWTPGEDRDVNFTEVKEYIVSLKRRGFNIKFVSFDQWNSDSVRAYLEGVGIETKKLSVSKPHYQDMALAIGENRVTGPDVALLKKELLQLRITNADKVDHPRSGSSDLADAVCGSIYNALVNAKKPGAELIEIETYSSTKPEIRNYIDKKDDSVIRKPKQDVDTMPVDLAEFLGAMKLL